MLLWPSSRASALALLTTVLAVGLCACGNGSDAPVPTTAGTASDPAVPGREPAFRMVVMTDLKGYIEPCGCTSRPLGGIDRSAALVAATRAQGPTLVVSAGDLFFSGEHHGPAPAQSAPEADGETRSAASSRAAAIQAQHQFEAELVADVLGGWQFAGAIPGGTDWAHAESMVALAQRASIPLLLSNRATTESPEGATPRSDGIQSTRVVEVAGTRVGLFGVAYYQPGDGVPALSDASAAATAAVTGLRGQGAELIVGLVHGDRRSARRIAGIDGVDLVVAGGIDDDTPIPPSVVAGSPVIHASRQGQGLAIVDVFLGEDAENRRFADVSPWTAEVAREALQAEANDLRARITRWEAEGVAADRLEQQRRRLASLEREAEASTTPPIPASGDAARIRFVELPPEAGQAAQVTAQMTALATRINDHNREAFADWLPEPAAEGDASYVGSAACNSCHGAAYQWWRRHQHGRAYATLERRDKQYNLSCVGCHVTGYLQPGGSTVTHLGPEGTLQDVGCENCHGPGSLHAASAGRVAPARTDVPESVCVGCHNPEHSDRFVYDAYRRTLIVPGHGLPVP